MSGIRGGRPPMRGSSRLSQRAGTPSAPAPQPVYHQLPSKAPATGKKRVLFVCIGNSCRSQMAEGFAKRLGGDFIDVRSAGLSPAMIVQEETHRTMLRRGIILEGQVPKGIEMVMREEFDVIVNMSGMRLPQIKTKHLLDWRIRDPIGRTEAVYEEVASEIQVLVTALVNELRAQLSPPA